MRLITLKDDQYFIRFPFDRFLNRAAADLPAATKFNKKWVVPVRFEEQVIDFAQRYGFKFTKPASINGREYPEVELPELDREIPLKMKPYDYQRKGIAYILREKKVIVGDQMGLGKTMQAIAAITAAKAFPCLVVCPASLKINWEREWEMWSEYKPIVLNDSIKNTFKLFYQAGLTQVFIVNYESLQKYFVRRMPDPTKGEKFELKNIHFHENKDFFKSIIIDESHRVKEPSTIQTKLTRGIAEGKEYRLLLTGTPVVNAPKDLAPQLAIAGRIKEFGGYQKFIETYGDPDLANLSELNYKLRSTCFFRRDKSEATDLPPKTRHKVYCDITTRKEYQAAEDDLAEYLRQYRKATDEQVQKSMKGEVMVRIGALKNIAARGKLPAVYDFINDTLENGEKLIVFGHLREVLNPIKEKYKSVSITGEDNTHQRQAAIDSFQNDPETNLIICSIAAAGVGITLTASSTVTFIEMGWHPAIMEQAEDRAHRIGQKTNVQCIYFIGRETIDEWVYQLIDEKRAVSNAATGAKDDVEEIIIDEIINLFNQKL